MIVVSVNLGRAQPVPGRRSEADASVTGIFKHPLDGPVRVTRAGLAGDLIGDARYHGGDDQAVYLYAQSDYQWWETILGRPLKPGTFGENLTLDCFDNASLAIGDRFLIGEVVLEVSAPRVPCATLSRRMEDSAFLKKFRNAERPGPYCRVIVEGEIRSGDTVRCEPRSGERLSLLDVYRAEFTRQDDPDELRRQLASPLAVRFREGRENRLAELAAKDHRQGPDA